MRSEIIRNFAMQCNVISPIMSLHNDLYDSYLHDAVSLLQKLIAAPSISRDEKAAADIMEHTMCDYGYQPERIGNNLLVKSSDWDDSRPTLLLNAHIDTVKPVATWTRDPFTPTVEGDRLYGLGSNDCGGGLVSLLQVFRILEAPSHHSAMALQRKKNYNLIYLASCEEEVSGIGGIRAVLPLLPKVDVAVVGEPTGMQPAIAERGLMVIDGVAHGKSGHAARNEGINAIYESLDDLLFIRDYCFERVSPLLGPTKMQCTVINSGTQHNVVPDECRFIIDVRTNEYYTNEEIFDFLKTKLKSDITARSFHLHSSSLMSEGQPADSLPAMFMQHFRQLGMEPFGSPTLSDQALMRFPSFKLGPGESSRSHSADEFICVSEISHAIETYIRLLS